MHRIDGPGATQAGQFTEGDPTQGVPATTVTGAWLNALQEEIAGVIEAADIDLDKPDNGQLLAAILAHIAANQEIGFETGDVKLTLATTAPAGWVMATDGTIGNAASGATARADDDTVGLYALLWTNVPDGFAPVTGGRGASAAADFAAGKPLALTRMLGRALAISGPGSGLTARDLGQYLGAETHQLASGEMPSHNHTGSTAAAGAHSHGGSTSTTGSHVHNANIRHDFTASSGGDGLNWPASAGTLTAAAMQAAGDHAHSISTDTAAAHAHTVTINNTGGGAAHNNMQPTVFLNAMVKL